jgi:protein-disulfide isomerase
MVKKETKVEHKKEHKECCSGNVWMYISIGLGIAFLIALVFAIAGATKTITPSSTTGIGTTQAGNIVINLFKTAQGIDVNVISVTEVNGMYKVTLSAQGQTGEIYVTLDGKFLSQGLVDIDALLVPPKAVEVGLGINPVKGPENAKATIVVFSDYQCPACIAVEPELNKVLKQFEGQVKFAFRNLPLTSIHEFAQKAAEASECAMDQNKFWEMHDKLFEANGDLAVDKLKQYAVELGLDATTFNTCLDSSKYANAVAQDVAEASALKVGGTPTFYINGKQYGFKSTESFAQNIASEIAAAN